LRRERESPGSGGPGGERESMKDKEWKGATKGKGQISRKKFCEAGRAESKQSKGRGIQNVGTKKEKRGKRGVGRGV